VDEWLDQLADALGVDPLDAEETREILDASREVAHGVERRYAPLASFLLGVAAGSGPAGGSRGEAFRSALERLRALIPPGGEAGSAG
jgi:hypothetical protein